MMIDKIKRFAKMKKKSAAKKLDSVKAFFSRKDKGAEEYFGDIDVDCEEEFDLEPVKDFVEDFIGLIIMDMNSYQDDISLLDIDGKMITSVCVADNKLKIRVSSASNNEHGVIEIKPTINGQFAHRLLEDEPNDKSRFRINFYGGASLEYLDLESKGELSYLTVLGRSN